MGILNMNWKEAEERAALDAAREAVNSEPMTPKARAARKALTFGEMYGLGPCRGGSIREALQDYPVEIIDEPLRIGRGQGIPYTERSEVLQVPFGSLLEQERNGRTLHEMMGHAISNPPEGFEVENVIQDSITYREKRRFTDATVVEVREQAIAGWSTFQRLYGEDPKDLSRYAPLAGAPGPRKVDEKRRAKDRKAAKAARAARRRNR